VVRVPAAERPAAGLASYDRLFIGGQWVAPSTPELIEAVSPVTELVLARVPAGGRPDIDAAVAAARKAFDEGPWPHLPAARRADHIMALRDEVARRRPELDEAFTLEIGGTRATAKAFHATALKVLETAAQRCRDFTFEQARQLERGTARVVLEPVGVVGAIIPWNGPVTNSCVKLAPALAAGCTVVLKPAPEGVVQVMMLAEAVDAAGFPPGVINIVPSGREVSEYLVTHPGVDKIAFTGSTAAGRRIMSLCGDRVRNVTLELGGKSAAIIADHIDLSRVLRWLVPGGISHSGQVCAALTRILVPRDRQEEVVSALATELAGWRVGDPADPQTRLGPLVAERQRDRVESYIRLGTEEGARLVIGGGRPAGLDRGWFVEPTVFADVRNDMRIAREEIFGPVLCVIPFDSVEEAIRLANDSDFGLSGAVFADDSALAERIARRLRTGSVCVNMWNICLTEPFGGFKQSGLGREGGPEGLLPYLETKLLQGV
jgi:acyl-CoA reductase-like NAD-dependent aldehyde dehydrogenase